MSGPVTSQLCRVTVHGPAGRADLAVPVTAPVAGLLPAFLRHTCQDGEVEAAAARQGTWVLQRLNGTRLDPDGTPETQDWLDGEELYLRTESAALPELTFDDVADGIATAVGRQPSRWTPEYGRRLFLGLGVLVLVLTAELLLSAPEVTVVAGFGFGVLLLVAAGWSAHRAAGRTLPSVLGLGGGAFVALACGSLPEGVTGLTDLRAGPVVAALLAVSACSSLLLLARSMALPELPLVPFAVALVCGASGAVALMAGGGLAAAGVLVVVFLALLAFAPRVVIRMAGLRSPQLPRTAEDLQTDVEPMDAGQLTARALLAEAWLSTVAVSAALVFVVSCVFLLADPGWAEMLFTTLAAVAILLRARGFQGAWQRTSLALAGAAGLGMVLGGAVPGLSAGWQLIWLAAEVAVFGALVAAAVRPPNQRPVPVWSHVANVVETVSSIAVVPVLLQVLGVYAWLRGLAG